MAEVKEEGTPRTGPPPKPQISAAADTAPRGDGARGRRRTLDTVLNSCFGCDKLVRLLVEPGFKWWQGGGAIATFLAVLRGRGAGPSDSRTARLICMATGRRAASVLPTLLVVAGGCRLRAAAVQAPRDVAAFIAAPPLCSAPVRCLAPRAGAVSRQHAFAFAALRGPPARRGASRSVVTRSSTSSADAGEEPRDKVGRPANWWQLPPVDNVPLVHHTDRYGRRVCSAHFLSLARARHRACHVC